MKIGFIGAGNMATAIIRGALKSQQFRGADMLIYDIDPKKSAEFEKDGLLIRDSVCGVAKEADVLLLAVKPQNYAEVLAEISDSVSEETVIITIAAGISSDYIVKNLGKKCPVVRVMPNTPLLVGCGATAVCKTKNVTQEKFEAAVRLFSENGLVEILDESQMNAVISVNGSSPAYVYLFAKAAADYAEKAGINKEAALRLFCKTLEGSAKMLTESKDTPDELIKKVCSPGGTTIAAMEKLDELGFYAAVQSAMEACTKRAEELGK